MCNKTLKFKKKDAWNEIKHWSYSIFDCTPHFTQNFTHSKLLTNPDTYSLSDPGIMPNLIKS